MTGRFAQKVALITGASRGIGLAVAHRLVSEGAKVVITGRKADSLAGAVDQLGGPATAVASVGRADDSRHTDETVKLAVEKFGRLDLLINNVGINPVLGPLVDTDPAAIRKIFEVNVLGTLHWTRTACSAFSGDGAVVNLGSVAGLLPASGIGAYGASKAALAHLTQQLAIELAPRVRVNAVLPAVVRTKFGGPLFEDREEEVTSRYPLGRLGQPEDVAAAVAYLASTDASWVTGQLLVLDGGLLLAGGI